MAGEDSRFIRLVFAELPEDEMHLRAMEFHELMDQRRTTRHFSSREVSTELIEAAVMTPVPHLREHISSRGPLSQSPILT